MSVDRTSVRSARATKRLNRTLLVGALLGLTLSAGVAPGSMAWGEDADASSGTPSATSDFGSPSVQDATFETPATTTEPPTPESSGTSEASSTPEPSETTAPPSADPSDQPTQSEEIIRVQGSSAAEESQIENGGIEPFTAGQPDGADAPYVYWTVKDSAGTPVGGATFNIQGPRNNNRNEDSAWGENPSRTVNDCQADPCLAEDGYYDLDPDPGEFLVKFMGADDSSPIDSSKRYRVQQTDSPGGYTWATSSNWKVIPGNRENPASNAWIDRTYNFKDFPVKELQTLMQCDAGYVYGINGNNAQIQQVAPDGSVTQIGSPFTYAASTYNGLGIGSAGSPVYAYSRSGSTATVMQFDTTTGQWSSTGKSNANAGGGTVAFVAGAVNLDTGTYLFGGFGTAGSWQNQRTVFRFWEYNPATDSVSFKGFVEIAAGTADTNNGDMAFDTSGNLFIVRNTGSNTNIYSVTAANLAAATGSTTTAIPSSPSKQVQTMNNVNGIAFDSNGKGYLSSETTVRQYDMPGWTNDTTSDYTKNLTTSHDLASCGSPPTIVIEKEIVGGRANNNPNDQFKLSLKQGNTTLGEATTEGGAPGVQEQRVGPLPTVRNVGLTFTETAAGTTNMSDYVSAYQCTVTHKDGTVVDLDKVNNTSGSITIPPTGEAVRCVFRNAPLVATVNIHKDLADAQGENPAPLRGWTVGATATATTGTGTVTGTPTTSTQKTNNDGDASWSFKFGSESDKATVNVMEEMQDIYAFHSGNCSITHIDGSSPEEPLTLDGPEDTALEGIVPGDTVDCTYVNKPAVGALAITKAFDDSVPEGSGTGVTFTGTYSCTLGDEDDPVASGTWSRTGTGAATLTPATGSVTADKIPNGASCSATEDEIAASAGLPDSSWVWGEPTIEPASVGIESGETGLITVTNKATQLLGSVIWTKIASGTENELLAGSTWTLTGPNVPADTVVTDCVAAPCDAGDYKDLDPDAGAFLLMNLPAGDYTLTEKTAPPGYQLVKDPINFTVVGGETIELDPIENDQQDGVTLPLTGGLGRDAFLIGGTLLLLTAAGAAVVRQRRLHRVQQS